MVNQIQERELGPIIILDSNSTFPRMLDFLSNYEAAGGMVLRFNANVGPRYIFQRNMLAELPEKFVLTDPDLKLSKNFQREHLQDFLMLTESTNLGKIGLSLSIKEFEDFDTEKTYQGLSIYEWEKQFWQVPIDIGQNFSAFRAPIDTTFAFYNQKFFNPDKFFEAIRVDKIRNEDVSARHLPWYSHTFIPNEEIQYYNETTKGFGITSWGMG